MVMSFLRRRRLLVIIGIVVIAVALGAWLLYGKTFTIVIPQEKLQEALDAKFPISKTHLGLLTITYSNPRVILEEGSDRLQVGADAEAVLAMNARRAKGSARISGTLEYARESGEFLLKDARVESLNIDGLPGAHAEKAREIASAAVKQFLERKPVYKLDQADMKQSLAKLLLKGVKVRNKALVVSMGIGR